MAASVKVEMNPIGALPPLGRVGMVYLNRDLSLAVGGGYRVVDDPLVARRVGAPGRRVKRRVLADLGEGGLVLGRRV